MALISDLLREFKPSNWSTENYASKQFVRIPLDTEAVECTEIKNEFIRHYGSKYKIVAIERIQAPFLYMRCQLHRIHYEKKNFPVRVSDSWTFCAVEEPNVDEFIQYNCDNRRRGLLSLYQLDMVGKCVIAKKNCAGFGSRDSNGYPDYLIRAENAKPLAVSPDKFANLFSHFNI